MSRRIMHIDLDTFFVSVERALNPELIGKPVVVGGMPDQRGVVSCASYEARKFGLHAAMPLRTAGKLCPQAVFIHGNHTRYIEYSRKFMAILADFSPALQPMGLDEAYLDATGFESLHCTIREMAVKIKNRIRSELGICASIGIAGCRVAAKVASGVSKPDGLIDIPEGGERAFLAPLPITRLPGIGKKTEEVVKSLGVQTISDLQTYPPGALKMRFGSYAEALQRRANGIDESPVEAHGISKSISHETTFNEDTRDRSILEATIRYLCEKVGASLRSQHRQAHCISLKLRYSDFTTITRQITLKQSDDTDQALYTAVHQLLEKELMKARQAVRLLGVAVSSLTEPSRQLELMNPQTQRLENLNRAIDRIRNKYGFSSIQTGQTMLLKDLYKQKSTQ